MGRAAPVGNGNVVGGAGKRDDTRSSIPRTTLLTGGWDRHPWSPQYGPLEAGRGDWMD